ncbi:fimbrial protein [Cupriavidus basilensis]|uniref:Fimbrial protein n=1 Tax=Cupriavidus basilensis TaxID=68895 RepID=A0ABT6ATF9_9BURK|nr:fimbrial protein [Cupriavidus basilensis]MDF3835663.1 fimbrial protein [Cupriavidus basilensis]
MITKKKAFTGLCLALAPIWAFAACTADTTDGKDHYIVLVSGFNPPPFSPGDIPMGGVIYEATAQGLSFKNAKNSTSPTTRCSSVTSTYVTGIGTPGANNIYPTSIPNIGIRILAPNGRFFPFVDSPLPWLTAPWNVAYAPKIQLVKTGNITAPGILAGAYARYTADHAAGQTLVEYQFAAPLIVTPRVPTCKVESPSSIPVPMGHVISATAFSGVGSTAPPQSFSIKLRCSGGDAETATRAFVTLTDATNPGNTSTTLSLSRDATAATGVGIQILKGDVVLGYGPDSSAVGNTNQWYAGTVKQGQATMSIDLQARYVQTAPKITSGSANAVATYTLSYQ